jgi:hypothetical protein
MKIYLSCDNGNDFFLNAVQDARANVIGKLKPTSIELIYPPRAWGGDTGKILNNVLQIGYADMVLVDISPAMLTVADGHQRQIAKYNEGVLIEYGIILALDNPRSGFLPWHGDVPKPSYRIFCSEKFKRSKLTPIVNTESVVSYGEDRNKLISTIEVEILNRMEKRLISTYTPRSQ